jgi:hypothetical protein
VRDGSRQTAGRRRAQVLADRLVADRLVDRPDGDGRPAERSAGPRRRPPETAEQNASERITLIEFLWEGPAGAQQVIFVSREWLQ